MCVFTPAAVAYIHVSVTKVIEGGIGAFTVCPTEYTCSATIALSIVNHAGKLNGNDSSTTFLETSAQLEKTKREAARVRREGFIRGNKSRLRPPFYDTAFYIPRDQMADRISGGDINVSLSEIQCSRRGRNFRRTTRSNGNSIGSLAGTTT